MKLRGIGAMSLFFFLTSSVPLCLADEVRIPFALKEKQFLEELKSRGFDASGSDTSQGFVKNEGGRMKVFSYHTMTPQQLDAIKDSAFKCVRD
jgi:hypothetical protein